MAAVLVSLLVGDHPQLFAAHRVQTLTLDAAYTDEAKLRAYIEELLGARVHLLKVRRLDLVEATTVVEARYELLAGRTPAVVTVPSIVSGLDQLPPDRSRE